MPKAPINPKRSRKRLFWETDLSEGSVTLRRCDLLNLVLTGKMEARLLYAAQRMEDAFAKLPTGSKPADAINALTPEDRAAVMEVLQQYACVAIAKPVVTLKDDGDESHMPVDLLTTNDLFRVWNATPPADVAVDPDQPVAILETASSEVEVDRVERFPESAVQPERADGDVPDDGGVVPPSEGVQTATILAADARVVEYAGL